MSMNEPFVEKFTVTKTELVYEKLDPYTGTPVWQGSFLGSEHDVTMVSPSGTLTVKMTIFNSGHAVNASDQYIVSIRPLRYETCDKCGSELKGPSYGRPR